MSHELNLDTQIKGSKWPSYTATDSGAANAYAITGIPLGPSLRGGSVVIFKAAHTNTGASTITVNGGSAIAIKKLGGSALVAGDIVANSIVTLVYDSVSTTFLYLTPGTIDFTNQAMNGILPIANGGTGTSTPSLVAGSNITISGSWPNQTIASSGGGGGGSGDYSTAPSNLPTASGMTWVNQGTSTATQTAASGPILLALADSGSLNWRLLAQSAPATPYKLIAMLRGATTPSLHNSQTIGIYFRSTGSGKLLGIECLLQTGGWVTRVERLNSVTSDNSTQATLSGQSSANNFAPVIAPFWYQLRNDGSTLYADWSFDGKNFTNLWSEAVGAFVSPDQIGAGGVSVTSGANANVLNYVLQFQTFNNATL